MRLHQLKIEFVPEHDRLMMRLSTDNGAEVLLWLTRRCVKRLWPLLVNMAQATPEIVVQPNPEARRALLGFQHEKAVRQADFSRPYEEAARERPLGTQPAPRHAHSAAPRPAGAPCPRTAADGRARRAPHARR